MSTPDLAAIDAVILAGGLGTRLKSVVPDQQKVFAVVGEQLFVVRIVAQLQYVGVRRVIFALGHLAEAALPWIARWRDESGLELIESIEASPQGTGGALRLALPLLALPHQQAQPVSKPAKRVAPQKQKPSLPTPWLRLWRI